MKPLVAFSRCRRRLQRSVSVAGSGRDVHEPARFPHIDPMPDPSGHDDRLTGMQRLDVFGPDSRCGAAVFEDHVDATGHQVEQLVAVRMQLTPMGRVALQ